MKVSSIRPPAGGHIADPIRTGQKLKKKGK